MVNNYGNSMLGSAEQYEFYDGKSITKMFICLHKRAIII